MRFTAVISNRLVTILGNRLKIVHRCGFQVTRLSRSIALSGLRGEANPRYKIKCLKEKFLISLLIFKVKFLLDKKIELSLSCRQ